MILKSVSNQQALALATHFFKYDYHDRGMLKWQGFFLSDHQAALHHQYRHHPIAVRPEESLPTISAKLLEGWQKQHVVIIQTKSLDLNQHPQSYLGIIKGFSGPTILLDQDRKTLTQIEMTDIRAVIEKSFDLDH